MPDAPIAVAVVEDDARIRSALELIVDGTPGMVCVAAYESVEDFLDEDLGQVDVLLLDIELPGMSGIEAIRPIRKKYPQTDVLMQTVFQDEDRIFEALCAGATGYLLKNTPPEQILEGIREVHAGGAPMSASIARKVVHLFRRPQIEEEALSERENEVLAKLVEGKTNKQIAEELFVSPNTVAFHVKGIYEKLHVHSRAEAVAKAMQRTRPTR